MKTILNIEHTYFLFPDETSAAKVMTLLAKALLVEKDYDRGDSSYAEIYTVKEARRLSMECLPAKAKVRGERPPKAAKPTTRKALPAPRVLMLTDGTRDD